MAGRPMKETVSARYEFTLQEQADMGKQLAGIRQKKTALDEEEKSQRDQIKERRSALELQDGSLSRAVSAGFEMRDIPCTLKWDDPNVGEVSYYRESDGDLLKSRAMTALERQMELPLDEGKPVEQTQEQTKANVEGFFDAKDQPATGEPATEPSSAPEAASKAGAAGKGKASRKKKTA